MQILGILVRTKTDRFTNIVHDSAAEILDASQRHGHIIVDLSHETAKRNNLHKIIRSIGSPKGNFLKIVLFYCYTSESSPLDQNGEPFISDETLTLFKGWGVYCIGCYVGRSNKLGSATV